MNYVGIYQDEEVVGEGEIYESRALFDRCQGEMLYLEPNEKGQSSSYWHIVGL